MGLIMYNYAHVYIQLYYWLLLLCCAFDNKVSFIDYVYVQMLSDYGQSLC